jgi:predicted amidophosphoribosyltransferase
MGEFSLCARCRRLVPPPRLGPCPVCAAALGPGADPSVCRDCERLRPRFVATVAAAPYAGFVGELVRRAKYGHDPLLAVPLADLLRSALRGSPVAAGIDAVLAVPPHPGRAAERGFHLADLLASSAAEEVRAPLRLDWLVRVGDPVPQAALPRTERRQAARGTVALRATHAAWARPRWTRPPDPSGCRVLVVDDVLTTGATVNECARVLLAAGAKEVRVAVATRA